MSSEPLDIAAIEQPLFEVLSHLGIATTTVRHPAVYTVAEAQRVRGPMDGGHLKNLFLRDKKRSLWLVTLREDRRVPLNVLRQAVGARGGFSFASAALLDEVLGVEPGSVTPFAALNDVDRRVTVVLDKALLEYEWVHCHPLHNRATTGIAPADLERFLEHIDHPPRWLDVDALVADELDEDGLEAESHS